MRRKRKTLERCVGRIYSICQDAGCGDLRGKESKVLRSLEPEGRYRRDFEFMSDEWKNKSTHLVSVI